MSAAGPQAGNGGGGTPASELFRGRTLLLLVMAGVLGFALFIILSTYAPDYRPASRLPVPANVQSKGGNGFAGLKRWLEAHDYQVSSGAGGDGAAPSANVAPASAPAPVAAPSDDDAEVMPDTAENETALAAPSAPMAPVSAPAPSYDDEDYVEDNLMIVTLEVDTPDERIEEIARARHGQPTLFILPKYLVRRKKDHDGWVEKVEKLPTELATEQLQTIRRAYGLTSGAAKISDWEVQNPPAYVKQLLIDDEPVDTKTMWRTVNFGSTVVETGENKNVLTELNEDAAVYVLADPDLMNNAGLADPNVAHAALDAIDEIAPSDVIIFDTTAQFPGKDKYSLMKLMLEPPFLALTLTIIFATLLAVLNGLGRFGPPRVPQRVFAFGKKSLVDMTALMMRRGRKLGGLAPNYLALVRTRAGEALGAPSNLSGEALDTWLEETDRRGAGDWRSLVREANRVEGPAQVKSIAQKLYDWKARRISER